MARPRPRLSQTLMIASFGLLFAGLSALMGSLGGSPYAPVGIGVGLIVAGLALSLAATQASGSGGEPPDDER